MRHNITAARAAIIAVGEAAIATVAQGGITMLALGVAAASIIMVVAVMRTVIAPLAPANSGALPVVKSLEE